MENEVTATETNEQTETTGAETKTYTFDEVQALLQSEADKRVTAALKKAEAKHQKELQDRKELLKSLDMVKSGNNYNKKIDLTYKDAVIDKQAKGKREC